MCHLFLTQKATAALIPVIGYRRLPSLYRCVDLRPRRSDAVSTLPRVFYILYAWLCVWSVGRCVRPNDGTKLDVFFERERRNGRIFHEKGRDDRDEFGRFDLSESQIHCGKLTMILVCFFEWGFDGFVASSQKKWSYVSLWGTFIRYIYVTAVETRVFWVHRRTVLVDVAAGKGFCLTRY